MDIFKAGVELTNDNQWRWKFSDTGEYLIKSGYAFARRWKLAIQSDYGEVSDWVRFGQIWNRFWKIRVPYRTKLVT